MGAFIKPPALRVVADFCCEGKVVQGGVGLRQVEEPSIAVAGMRPQAKEKERVRYNCTRA